MTLQPLISNNNKILYLTPSIIYDFALKFIVSISLNIHKIDLVLYKINLKIKSCERNSKNLL